MRRQTVRSTLWTLFFCLISVVGHADEGNFFVRLDQDIFDAIHDEPPRSEPLGTIMEVGTYFGDGRTMLGVSLLLMAYGDDNNRETGRLLTSTFISTGVIVWGLKEIIGRKRPLDEEVGNPAFPSGHTAYAFAGATVLGNRYPKLRIPLYIGAGLVGLTRIYLGRHYASDVIAGAAVGTITGALVSRHRGTLLEWRF
ncbi:phosphatase PAP2 family protein [Candidatus Poribacteria bacterium]|nr:phosphatase PAP2 family protein [Candidatus Poribacteria bacterium]